MRSALRKEQYKEVVRDLRSEKYRTLLGELQQTEPFLQQFPNWDGVIRFMRKGTSHDPAKDTVLQAIFRAHAGTQDHRLRTALLAIFWPGLESIYHRKRSWDTDADSRWSNVIWTFLQVICRIDLLKRSNRLVQKVINDTIHGLYSEYKRDWDRASVETLMDPDQLADVAGATEAPEFSDIELRDEQESQAADLRRHVESGHITEGGFHVLVGTRVYGKLLRECAEELGLSVDAVKQRRLRAEAAIRRHQEGN